VALTIPAVVGPYTLVDCRLTLLSSQTRIDPRLTILAHACWGRCRSRAPVDPTAGAPVRPGVPAGAQEEAARLPLRHGACPGCRKRRDRAPWADASGLSHSRRPPFGALVRRGRGDRDIDRAERFGAVSSCSSGTSGTCRSSAARWSRLLDEPDRRLVLHRRTEAAPVRDELVGGHSPYTAVSFSAEPSGQPHGLGANMATSDVNAAFTRRVNNQSAADLTSPCTSQPRAVRKPSCCDLWQRTSA
jgi:hypothetical protein